MQAAQVAAGEAAASQQEAAVAAESRLQGQVRDMEASLQGWQEHCESLAYQQKSLRAELQAGTMFSALYFHTLLAQRHAAFSQAGLLCRIHLSTPEALHRLL